jgi:type I restriction enzyme S subunit
MGAVSKNPAFTAWIKAAALPWRTASCRRFNAIRNGGTPSSQTPEFWDGEIMWLTPDDLGKIKGKSVSESQRMITDEGVAGSNAAIVPTGSILLSTRAPIGHIAIAARETAFNQGCRAIVPSPAIYQSDYLYYYALASRPVLQASGNGTTFKELSWEDLASLPLPLSPLEEQEAISSFLDRETARIDALSGKKRRLLELLEEKRLAVITHAVTKGLDPNAPMKDSGIEWLGQVPAHWDLKQLRHVTKLGTIITYGIVQAGPDVEDGVPYIRTSDMAGEELPLEGYLRTTPEIDASYARSKVAEGDLVIAIRATIGKPLIVPAALDGANLTQGTAKYSPSEQMNAQYVRYLLRSHGAISEFHRLAKGATFKEITLEMLRKFPVLQPPISEQKDISQWIESKSGMLVAARNKTAATIMHLQEYRSALITNAVTGKIDVRGEVEKEAAA